MSKKLNQIDDESSKWMIEFSRETLAAAVDVLRDNDDPREAPALLLAMASIINRLEKLLASEAGTRRARMAAHRRLRTPRRMAA